MHLGADLARSSGPDQFLGQDVHGCCEKESVNTERCPDLFKDLIFAIVDCLIELCHIVVDALQCVDAICCRSHESPVLPPALLAGLSEVTGNICQNAHGLVPDSNSEDLKPFLTSVVRVVNMIAAC